MARPYQDLTAQQRKFADAVIGGATGSDAARAAGVTGAPRYIAERAAKWMANPKVKDAIAKGRAALAEEDLLTRREAVGILARIAKGKDKRASTRDRIAALAQASRMLGYDAPTKVTMKVEGSLLHRIRSGAGNGGAGTSGNG
jgi:phage terminase small subunit